MDCIRINGFNNDFIGWGREDSEFASRLLNTGIKRINLKFNAIQYHLWHQESSKKSLFFNDEILFLMDLVLYISLSRFFSLIIEEISLSES